MRIDGGVELMNFVAWAIVACEVGFWLFILAGLLARYIFNQDKLAIWLFIMVPVLDLLLIIVTGTDLLRGGTVTMAHSIAPLYLAISVIYGKDMINWADERFLYYIKRTGAKPYRRVGMDYAKHSMKGSLKHVIAYIVGGLMLIGMLYLAQDDKSQDIIWGTLTTWGIVVIVDNAISISYFVWRRK